LSSLFAILLVATTSSGLLELVAFPSVQMKAIRCVLLVIGPDVADQRGIVSLNVLLLASGKIGLIRTDYARVGKAIWRPLKSPTKPLNALVFK